MKTLTIKQPWATLIMLGYKKYEFRTWNTKFRGEFLVHAGKSVDEEAVKRLKKYLPETLPTGKILGKVTLTDCIEMNEKLIEELKKDNTDIYTASSFSNEYAFKLENVEQFEDKIEVNGQLGFWNYNYEK